MAPNAIDDGQLMVEALPELKERTDVEEMYTDGGYNGGAVDATLEAHPVKHIQTAMRDGTPDPDRLHLADFTITTDADSEPLRTTCPNGVEAKVRPGRSPERFIARFSHKTCEAARLPINVLRSRANVDAEAALCTSPGKISKLLKAARRWRNIAPPRNISGPPSKPPSARSNIPFVRASSRCAVSRE